MKKLLFILITLFLPILAVANNSGKCGDGVTYIIEESTGTLTISKTSEGTGEMDNYYTYSTHAPWCNSNYQYLIKKVVIDDGVISIGRNSFSYLYNLASIEIPNSVRSIGEGAFYETAWYNQQPDGLVYGGKVAYKYKGVMPENTQIEIAEGTLGISENAFSNCNGLVSLTIPEGVTSIGSYAFYGCSKLSTLNIPNSISHIGVSLFEGTPWYENLPNGLTYIGKIAFKYIGAMPQNTKIEIKEGTVEIYECAFINCSGLTSVTIPDGVTNIGFSAFNGCCNLKSVVIPNSVTSIGIQAFAYCSALSSITFPSGITSVGNEAFYGTTWLNNQPDGLVYIGKVAYKYKGSPAANTHVVIKDGIIGISSNAFYDCGGLSSVTIPNSVIRIEDRAFLGCNGMTSINIPNSVTFIGSAAFHGCSCLTSITIPYSVTSIGDYAFEDCSNLSLVTILAPSLDYYGESVFANNATGRIVYVPSANVSTYKNKWSKISNYIYYLGENSGSCGENVTYSYEESTGLLLISGEGRMSDFGYYVQTPWKSFSSSIKNVIIETGVTSIGDNAFTDCSSLSTITVPISVDYISEGALSGTEWFENQPDGLVYAGKVAYKYKGSAPDNTVIVIKDGTLSITASAFYDCKGISSVSIPNSVATIGKSAFYGCSDLVSMTIPNNVSFINDNTSLVSLKIVKI